MYAKQQSHEDAIAWVQVGLDRRSCPVSILSRNLIEPDHVMTKRPISWCNCYTDRASKRCKLLSLVQSLSDIDRISSVSSAAEHDRIYQVFEMKTRAGCCHRFRRVFQVDGSIWDIVDGHNLRRLGLR